MKSKYLLFVLVSLVAACSHTQPAAPSSSPGPGTSPTPTSSPVQRSNQHSARLVALLGRFSPEGMGSFGIEGLDELTWDLDPGVSERVAQATDALAAEFENARQHETDVFVAQDLGILAHKARSIAEEERLEDELLVPLLDVHKNVFKGLKTLLKADAPESKCKAAMVRLRKYAGLEAGRPSVVHLAMERTKERLGGNRLMPTKASVQELLANAPTMRKAIAELLAQNPMEGSTQAAHTLDSELQQYEAFITSSILPRARIDTRLPERLYAFRLRKLGVDQDPASLAAEARAAYAATRKEAEELAQQVAKERGLAQSSFGAVMKALKKEQLGDDTIVAHYQQRIRDVEAILSRERLITLPSRALAFRMATPAEAVMNRSPTIDIQGFLQGKQEIAFVLPREASATDPAARYDDFTFPAASWTLVAHEGRPGHELQFTAISTRGLSLARMLFAFNSANVEGWGLYAEHMVRPHMPTDGRLASLQALMLRQARAFLDPELQAGKISQEEARRVLLEEVCLSPAAVQSEINRYTWEDPGQATTYFWGFQRMLELRKEVESVQGSTFSAQRFHDAVIAQGLLPLRELQTAVKQNALESQGR